MANIAELAVQLTAKTGRFNSGMRGATKQVNVFGSATSMVSRRLVAFAASAVAMGAAFLSVRGIIRAVGSEMKKIDNLGKSARWFGITVQGLTQLEHAAALSGLSLEDVSASLRYMGRNIADASQDSGQAQDAIRMLGLDAKEFVKLLPEEQLLQIADGFAQISNASFRSSVVMDLFGRSGSKMIPLLEGGSRAIISMADDANKLGLTLSSVDSFQIEYANDAIFRMQSLWTGIKRTLAVELSPFIKSISDDFVQWATSGEGLRDTLLNSMESIAMSMKPIIDYAERMTKLFQNMQDTGTFSELIKALKQINAYISMPGKIWTTALGGLLGIGDGDPKNTKQRDQARNTGLEWFNNIRNKIRGEKWLSRIRAEAAAREVDERRANNAELDSTNEKLKEATERSQALASQAKQQFGSGRRGTFAINTPLNAALSATIMRGDAAKKQQVYSPQFDTMISKLTSIDNNTQDMTAVAGD